MVGFDDDCSSRAGGWHVLESVPTRRLRQLWSYERREGRVILAFRIEREHLFSQGGTQQTLIGGNEDQVVTASAQQMRDCYRRFECDCVRRVDRMGHDESK